MLQELQSAWRVRSDRAGESGRWRRARGSFGPQLTRDMRASAVTSKDGLQPKRCSDIPEANDGCHATDMVAGPGCPTAESIHVHEE